jgi:hypothetical protein
MNNTQLYIPDRLKVGFVEREDTYTKRLGYVIYYDGKGVLRKETSWEGWRDKEIPAVECQNEPTEGFVLNRDVGGARRSYGWDVRIEKVRVYDPRGFEFEIDIPNLLFILKEADCSRGKGLEGKFVYAWRGNSLILLPVGCEDYRASQSYTTLQSKAVTSKELIPGACYLTKKQQTLIYLGRFDYHWMDMSRYTNEEHKAQAERRYVFWDADGKGCFKHFKDLKSIAALQFDVVHEDFASLVDKWHHSIHGTRIVRFHLRSTEDNRWHEPWYFTEEAPARGDGPAIAWFYRCATLRTGTGESIESIQRDLRFGIVNGVAVCSPLEESTPAPGMGYAYNNWRYGRYPHNPSFKYRPPTLDRLFAELESGAVFQVDNWSFSKD